MLGYPDQALTQSHEALALAQEGARPEQLAMVLYTKAELHWRRREPAAALQSAEAALALATEQGFGHSIGHALLRRGWALAAQGRVMEGLADLRQGLAYREAVGAIVGRSYDPIFLAEVYGSTGQVEEGLHVLAEMRVAVDNSGFVAWKPRYTGSRERCCCSRPSRMHRRRKPTSSRLWRWRAASRPSRMSCAPL